MKSAVFSHQYDLQIMGNPIIKRTPAQSTKMRLCAFRESTFIEEQMYAVPICEHGCAR